MRRFGILSLILTFALAISFPAWAKTYEFELPVKAMLNGKQLEAGHYELKMTQENEAHIYHNGRLMTKAKVMNVRPLHETEEPNSVVQNPKGAITEIRLDDKVLMFSK